MRARCASLDTPSRSHCSSPSSPMREKAVRNWRTGSSGSENSGRRHTPTHRVPLPCIVELKGEVPTFAVLARVEGGRALLHESRPITMSVEELGKRLSGRALFIASRASSVAGLARFDFGWFIPAIVKYRKLIGEALV